MTDALDRLAELEARLRNDHTILPADKRLDPESEEETICDECDSLWPCPAIQAADALPALIEVAKAAQYAAEWADDPGTCPYLDRYESVEGHDPDAVCGGFGCQDEPSCVTDHPRGGWPSRRLKATLASLDAALPEQSTRPDLITASNARVSEYLRKREGQTWEQRP